MSITFDGTKLRKHTHNGYKVSKWTHDGVKVFSSGTVVSYYNGSSLIGTKEYNEGADVLKPGYSPTKSGYTFIGWSTSKNGSRLETLTAGSEPITLYAVFAINSLTAVEGHLAAGPTWVIDSSNPAIVSGTIVHSNESYGDSSENTTYFTVNKGVYSTAKIVFGGIDWNGDSVLLFKLDGVNCVADTEYTISGGQHSVYTHVFPNDHYERKLVGIKSLVLSNPTKWQ